MGLDQRIRSAMITVAPNKTIRRALSLLYPIECPEARDISKETATEENCANKLNIDDDENENRDVNHDVLIVDQDTSQNKRPIRKTVIEARRRLQQWLNPEEE